MKVVTDDRDTDEDVDAVAVELQQVELACAADRGASGGHVELGDDVPRAGPGRVDGHEQLAGDLGTAQVGREQPEHLDLTLAQGLPISQALLRDYFPMGTDLSGVSAEHLTLVTAEINDRPCRTLRWVHPADLDACSDPT